VRARLQGTRFSTVRDRILPARITSTATRTSFDFLMGGVVLAGWTELLKLQPVLVLLFVLGCRIIAILTF
jgi:hypothetical protein